MEKVDYSDLIIVGYKGGWGGDMFSSLVYRNFNPEYQYQYRPLKGDRINNNHVMFEEAHSLERFKCIREILNICDIMIREPNTGDGVHNVLTNLSKGMLKEVLNFVYDPDPAVIIENVIELGRHLYSFKPPKVWSCHYANTPPELFKDFRLDMMFPKSKKIRLVSDQKHDILFLGLFIYKLNANYFYDAAFDKNKEYKNMHSAYEETLKRRYQWRDFDTEFEDFVDINSGRLFLENCSNIDEVEDQLSNLIGQRIVLDREYLEKVYNPKNEAILRLLFGPNYLTNDNETNTNLLIEYGRERAKQNF